MDTTKAEGKRSMKEVVEGDDDEDEDAGEDNKKKRGVSLSGRKVTSIGGAGGSTQPSCQVEDCTANLKDAKPYYRRHRVCEQHSKAPVVLVAGIQQRFCQQCSRFHELSEFDGVKKSCRRRLAGHNERRRKSSCDTHGEG